MSKENKKRNNLKIQTNIINRIMEAKDQFEDKLLIGEGATLDMTVKDKRINIHLVTKDSYQKDVHTNTVISFSLTVNKHDHNPDRVYVCINNEKLSWAKIHTTPEPTYFTNNKFHKMLGVMIIRVLQLERQNRINQEQKQVKTDNTGVLEEIREKVGMDKTLGGTNFIDREAYMKVEPNVASLKGDIHIYDVSLVDPDIQTMIRKMVELVKKYR